MIFGTAAPSILQIILFIPIFIWAIISGIMTLEDENRGKRALTGWDWMKNYSPKWHKRVTIFIILPLIVAALLCRYFGL
jgi:hypothetical protein